MQDISADTLFREVQRFPQVWVWILVLGIAAVTFWALVQQVILGQPFGSNPGSDTLVIVITVIFGVGFPLLFYSLNLATEVRRDGIYYRYFPFHLSYRRIGFEEIIEHGVREFSALKDYGGWGIRYGREGKAYIVSGNSGVKLAFSNGRGLLIGSRKSEEFDRAIEAAMTGRK